MRGATPPPTRAARANRRAGGRVGPWASEATTVTSPSSDQLPGGLACVIAVIAGFLAGAYLRQAVAEQY